MKILLCIGIFLVTRFAFAASFDCTNAATTVEHLICADPTVSELDSNLVLIYKKVLTATENTEVLRADQRIWLTQKRDKCIDVDCLRSKYEKRILELNAISLPDAVKITKSNIVPNASIEEIANYKSPPVLVNANAIAPYTMSEIIKKLAIMLDDRGLFIKGRGADWLSYADPQAIAFDEQRFGKCTDLYISRELSRGGLILSATMKFLFSADEDTKARASSDLKGHFEYIKDPVNLRYQNSYACDDREKYVSNLKDVMNAVIQSSPKILEERLRMVKAAKDIESQKLAAAQQNASKKVREEELRIAKIAQEDREKIEKQKSNTQLNQLYLALAAIAGAFVWHKFIRRRCPSCNATSPDLINTKELDSWRGTKKITEKLSNGKSRERVVSTTYKNVERTYKCTACDHKWDVISKEEK